MPVLNCKGAVHFLDSPLLVISSRFAARNLAYQGADFSSLALVEMTK